MIKPLRSQFIERRLIVGKPYTGVCYASDGVDYVVKRHISGWHINHSEWFASHLCAHVGIPTPVCALIQRKHDVLFGSRWETGHIQRWWEVAQRGVIDIGQIGPILSRILAFDMFIANRDRHVNNYIIRKQKTRTAVLALDFSRSWAAAGLPFPEYQDPPDTKTMEAFLFLSSRLGPFIVRQQMLDVLDCLRQCTLDDVESIIDSHPPQWLGEGDKDKMLLWWSETSLKRIETLSLWCEKLCHRYGVENRHPKN